MVKVGCDVNVDGGLHSRNGDDGDRVIVNQEVSVSCDKLFP